ncbi:MAG: sugar transferase, partial [Bacteroidia bacterium]
MEEKKYRIACVHVHKSPFSFDMEVLESEFNILPYDDFVSLIHGLQEKSISHINGLIFFGSERPPLQILQKLAALGIYPLVWKTGRITPLNREAALRSKLSEMFDESSTAEDVIRRMNYLIEHPARLTIDIPNDVRYRMPLVKRLFDLLASSLALILLLPLFLLIALAIRMESKGPVFYYSWRIGTGFQAFKFYKFRSMYTGADARLKELKHLNQYGIAAETSSPAHGNPSAPLENSDGLLYTDGMALTEAAFRQLKKEKEGATFIKIKDDPRVTRVGRFIRNTSLDELPQ